MIEPLSQETFITRKQTVLLSNGIRLAYVELGDAKGVPVLLLHGFTDSARSWSLIAPHLAADFRLIAPDLRGHGQSDKPEGCYTIPEMAHDIRLLIRELELAPVHVVGHSLGGRLTQAIAERWPQVVRKIVLMSTSAVPRERKGWLWGNILALRDPIDPEGAFVREWCSTSLPVDENFLAHVRRESAAVPARVWHSIHYEQLAYDPAPLLQDISAPALILRGEEDEIATAEHQDQLKGGIIGSRFISLPGRGHNMHWEAAETLARLFDAFLKES
ncbi:hydrolase [Sinorhizobium fredii USDA 205]|uniref:Alpha/beta fold hydrolase n=1 Tax=Rhizobium fredii TaxID=380 RepID=A0A844A936_RHIFR|nr:alpha/beta hydrolase [Sinorhizobium fredii]ASY71840.1 N-formylglutamate deformylase [Sinorhizobium fredii CCBAU 83666]KSV81999.1 hydrolase [Sinorhizobium fredii USDA 205]MQX09619.1 alpha/beta fold hydrolase [Sinorhizobium fredii]UTY46789.1 alpha/beta hydrolase [Sinorhizobium fredii]GEC35378.1 alpha/beta hydrolase [Sinorhizobium fredii]